MARKRRKKRKTLRTGLGLRTRAAPAQRVGLRRSPAPRTSENGHFDRLLS